MRRRYRFHGRVQGVGFRATARHLARGFALSGWVRNEPDGSVLLEAQADPGEIDRFIDELSRHHNPRISRMETTEITVVEDETGFRIEY
jgi:acylphosphatase